MPVEYPHAGLRIADPSEKQNGHGGRKDNISDSMLHAHRVGIQHGETRCGQKSHAAVEEGFKEVAQGVDRVRVIAVKSHDNVAARVSEAFFVGPPVTSIEFGNDN